ncbi:hypothetical protein CA3LBN_000950 [Candidozyma haemuli]|uniref:RING-type domain-containing protein n=1 Tax=Candidozyma haemuli TaxID=45357 RepID=A0ABX8I129_9ASCO|nr:hypothetical protein CA3LBN_000950 [[Candida] haemuloni]
MPHSDTESTGSEISFDYEDDDNSVISFEEAYSDDASQGTQEDYSQDEPQNLTSRSKPSPNCLTSCHYRPMKLSWYIMEKMIIPARKLTNTLILGHSLDEILVMLHYKKWSVDELTSDFYDDSDRLREKCGLHREPNKTYPITKHEDYMCYICCESGPMETFSLSCGHEFCVQCYGQYLDGIIKKGELAQCMDPQCNMVLYHSDVEKLLQFVPPEEEVPMEKLDIDSDSSDEESVENNVADFNNYEVNLATEYDLHFSNVEFKNESWPNESSEPLLQNALLQAAAKSALEASRKRYKWCPAVDCDGFVELSGDTRPYDYDHRKNELLKHTPIRFAVHQRSMKGDEKTLASIHRYMLLYMKSQTTNNKKNVSWNDAQFMSDAIRSLIGGRRTLMWSYAFMFYLDKSNYCDILEGMQDYLNDSVESLSKIFEDVGAEKKKKSEENIMMALTKKRTKIVHLSSLVLKRQRLLIECAGQGLDDKTSSASKIHAPKSTSDPFQRSQSTQLPHTPRPNELRHRAIRNEQIRHSSTSALETPRAVVPPLKNIQMVQDAPFRTLNPPHSHKFGNRWAQFNLEEVQQRPKSAEDESVNNSVPTPHKRRINISPMTQLKPALHSQTSDSENSPADRDQAEASDTYNSHPSNNSSITEKFSGQSWASLSRSGKVSSHASMNTLVPMPKSKIELNRGASDDVEEINDRIDRDEDRQLATGDADDVETTDMSTIFEIAKEIQDFQDLVARQGKQKSEGANRTTQRMLDLKQYQEEQDASVVHVIGDSQSNLRCSAGVLGSIQRCPIRAKSHETNMVDASNKDEYLMNLWTEEFQETFDGRLRSTSISNDEGEDIYSGPSDISPDTHPEDELYGEDIRRPQANDDSEYETSEEETSLPRPRARGTGLTTRWPREREYRVRQFGADSEVLGSARERLRRRSLSRARILRSRILVYDSSSDSFILWFQNTDHFRSYEYFLRRRPSVAAMIALYVWVGSHIFLTNYNSSMSKRVNLPYAYQDLFPQAANSPRDFRTPGSISAASFAESSSRNTASAFAPARTHDRQGLLGNWKRLLKRLFKPKTLDFETATWEVFHLIVNPRKMYRSNYTYKQQNSRRSSYARDDPSFLILLTALLSFSAIAWGLAYSPHFWDIVKLIINMVCVDFYVTGFFIATLSWLLTNKLANSSFSIPHAFSAASRYNVNYIDWTFCFDVHCNSFLMIWCLLYMLQFFLLPLINSKKSFVSLLLGNSLYFGAVRSGS